VAGYALYLPKFRGANPDHLKTVGLDSLLLDGAPEFADVLEHGPDGGGGMLACWRKGDPANDPPFSPSHYHWQPCKADKARELPERRFWLGIVNGKPLRPKDCERKVMHLGYGVTLRDDQVWTIPAAVNLPHYHGLNGDGEYTRQIADEHRDFWHQSEKYAVEFFKAVDQLEQLRMHRPDIDQSQTVTFTLADAWEFCCRALALNYKLTPELIDLLGLIDDQGMRNIIKSAIDLPVILEVSAQKKTDEFSIPVG
jgi:hypothetical protein